MMSDPQNGAPPCLNGNEVLDVKPLRVLSPMLPFTLGGNAFTTSSVTHFVYVTPNFSSSANIQPMVPSGSTMLFPRFAAPKAHEPATFNPHQANNSSFIAPTADCKHKRASAKGCAPAASPPSSFMTPFANIIHLDDDDEGPSIVGSTLLPDNKMEHSIPLNSYKAIGSEPEGQSEEKLRRKKPRKVSHQEDISVLHDTRFGPREAVQGVLTTFDSFRRRVMQLDEISNINSKPVARAGKIMSDNAFRANNVKRIGSIPGVEVGDIFYYRTEVLLVGLHAHSVGGIDYMNVKFDNEVDSVAICIVSAGGYENEESDPDHLIYTGQGGSSKDDKKHDQKLERGNLALERSMHRGIDVRVIRSAKDRSRQSGKIYIYDGLYTVQRSWFELGKAGFKIFKFKLSRQPNQPEGISIWKKVEQWKKNPASRGKLILPDISSGIENLPVCLVNDVDDEKGPSYFVYSTALTHHSLIGQTNAMHAGCTCVGDCRAGNAKCSCSVQNGGNPPYSSSGILLSRRPLIYECSSSCLCSVNCHNRLTQRGIKFHFEVFRTSNRGWGLRCWDPICAGSFICEYAGEVIGENTTDYPDDEDDYIFRQMHLDEKAGNWNYIPEFLKENISPETIDFSMPFSIAITAKNMGNFSRFMNHSCSPNVFWQAVKRGHADEGNTHVMFFAQKHIPPMTELTYDYGGSGNCQKEDDSGNYMDRSKKCLCGSQTCRGSFD